MPAPVFAYESGKDLVRQAVNLQQGARPEICFETRLPAGDVQLYCDAQQVAQALTNLLQNAVESVLERMKQQGGGGSPGRVVVKLIEKPDRCLIEVHDNGTGLPEPAERLTEPYVTMRRSGTGLGLAIVKKIMEEHGGSLALRNRPAGGACVALAFPAFRALGEAAE
jgi:two-component system nitrogen regulation sensor histidine kinase NtrY